MSAKCSVRLYLQLFVGGFMSCICYLLVVSITYCVVFFFVLCSLCCQFLWIVYFWLPLRYSLTFISGVAKQFWNVTSFQFCQIAFYCDLYSHILRYRDSLLLKHSALKCNIYIKCIAIIVIANIYIAHII